jgi:hypothetical protein
MVEIITAGITVCLLTIALSEELRAGGEMPEAAGLRPTARRAPKLNAMPSQKMSKDRHFGSHGRQQL